MKQVFLNRFKGDAKQTLGELLFEGKEVAKTLELAWNNNNNRISCIPTGVYKVVRRKSAKYGNHFHVTNVPKRDFILIHNANYHYQLLGCIAVGRQHLDINKDGFLDVTESKNTMAKLLKLLPLEFELVIS
jgi:Family of unknown function (DUF5675)